MSLQKTGSEVLKTWYFLYCAFWSTDQWGGGGGWTPKPPPPLRTPLLWIELLFVAVLSYPFCRRTAPDAIYQTICTLFVLERSCTCLRISSDPMFLWILLNSCPLNLVLVPSHQAEMVIVKRFIEGQNKQTRVRVEPKSCDQGRLKNDFFALLATLQTKYYDSQLC